MGTVFVVQESIGKNLTSAKEFGDIEVIFQLSDQVYYSDSQPFIDKCEDVLEEFDPEKDYILLLGDPVLISVVGSVLSQRVFGYNVLKWDRQSSTYVPVYIGEFLFKYNP